LNFALTFLQFTLFLGLTFLQFQKTILSLSLIYNELFFRIKYGKKSYFERDIDNDLLAWSEDNVVQKHDKIIPIEVKSGTQGAMQSLRLFMKEKNIAKGIRTSLENFAQYNNIDVYPMYAISNLIKS
jgi:hypothetical protein